MKYWEKILSVVFLTKTKKTAEVHDSYMLASSISAWSEHQYNMAETSELLLESGPFSSTFCVY